MKLIVSIIIIIVFSSSNLISKKNFKGKLCFDIHELIKYTTVYRSNLSFNKNLIAKNFEAEIYESFIYINDSESRILERIKKDEENFIREEIGLDSNEIRNLSYTTLNELFSILDTSSVINTMIFYVPYNDYIILVEVYFRDVSKEFTLYSKINNVLNEINSNGFDISKFNAINRYYLFKCDDEKGLEYIGLFREAYIP